MNISLLYNKKAGEGVALDHILDVIAEHGHNVVCVVDDRSDVGRLLHDGPDVVVAAGGDGTIAPAARLVARRRTPLAILPLGTANNIATSFGILGPIEDLVAGWGTARRVRLDLGVADGMPGRRRFVEGVGAGLIPAAIADMQTRSDGDDLPADARMAGAVRTIRDAFSKLQPFEATIVADGVQTAGTFLSVEILNTPLIGPNLVLAADANPSDGLFDVVMARDSDRNTILRYLEDRLEGRDSSLSLPSQRARAVTLQGATDVHVDDQACSGSPQQTISIHLEAGAVELLV